MNKLCSIILGSFFVCGCSSTIRLNATSDSSRQYFVLQLPKAKLYFNKSDVMAYAATKEFDKIKVSNPDFDQLVLRVRENKNDTLSFPVVRDDKPKDVHSDAHALLSLCYLDFIAQNKFLAYDILNEKFQSEIHIKKKKSKHGSWLSYCFPDGREFYAYVTSRTEY